ncbi:MAG: carbon-monoxide dehydrogenase large subunit [Gammaproteobacteria bacterium]
MGNDLSLISVITGDTDATSLGFGGFNSRQTVIAGASAHAAASKVRKKVLALAGTLLEVAESDLEFNGEIISVTGSPDITISLGELARAAAGLPGFKLPLAEMNPGLEATESVVIDDMVYANGAAVAEVEVDIDTGLVMITRFLLAHDCGRMINPQIVDGQIVGAIAHGIGNALFEWMGFDEEAQPITTTLADYLLVSAANVPTIELFHHESSSPLNELGVKGVGESGCIPTPAAIISAIEDALSPLHIKINQAPVTPDILWDLIHNSKDSTPVHWQSENMDKQEKLNG